MPPDGNVGLDSEQKQHLTLLWTRAALNFVITEFLNKIWTLYTFLVREENCRSAIRTNAVQCD